MITHTNKNHDTGNCSVQSVKKGVCLKNVHRFSFSLSGRVEWVWIVLMKGHQTVCVFVTKIVWVCEGGLEKHTPWKSCWDLTVFLLYKQRSYVHVQACSCDSERGYVRTETERWNRMWGQQADDSFDNLAFTLQCSPQIYFFCLVISPSLQLNMRANVPRRLLKSRKI